MRNLRSSRVLLLGLALVAFGFVGCGSKAVTLNGKVILPANAQVIDGDSLVLTFIPEGGAKKYAAEVNAKDFSFNTNATKGIPPGKYKLAFEINPYMGGEDAKRAASLEVVNQAFSASSTKLVYEVPASSHSITVDLGQGKVTKN